MSLQLKEEKIENRWEQYFVANSLQIFLKPFIFRMEAVFLELKFYLDSLAIHSKSLLMPADKLQDLIYKDFASMLLNKVIRVFILELNSARIKGLLKAETSEQRFNYFIDCLCELELLEKLLNKYPVLKSQIDIGIKQYLQVSKELFFRLDQDFLEIQALLFPQQIEQQNWQLVDIQRGGDTHQQGRCVSFLIFQSEHLVTQKIVYKPRPAALDEAYDYFINWINPLLKQALITPLSLYKKDYAWFGVVTHQSCQQEKELQAYYQRLGYLLGIMYLLCGSDIHFENVIAQGEHPVIVDLECLFTPMVNFSDTKNNLTVDYFLVIDTLFLPIQHMVDKDSLGFDMSAFGGLGGERAPYTTIDVIDIGLDTMSIRRKQHYLERKENIPKLNDQAIEPAAYQQNFIEGFKEIYHVFLNQKDTLLSDDTPLNKFKHIQTRFIIRNTSAYGKLLFESFHPKFLYDLNAWETHFSWFQEAESSVALQAVLQAERRDLWEGNIPIFYSITDQKTFYDSYGNKLPVNIIKTGYERVMTHIEKHLHEQDYLKQLNCIEQSFAAYQTNNNKGKEKVTYPKIAGDLTQDNYKNRCLIIAKRQLDQIMQYTIEDEKSLTWVGVEYAADKIWRPGRIDISLYQGLSGIILTFAYAEKMLNESCYRQFAEKGYRFLAAILENISNTKELTIGAFTGLSGILYVLHSLYCLWQDSALLKTINTCIKLFLSIAPEEFAYDMVDGIAGCLAVLSTCAIYFEPQLLATFKSQLMERFFQLYSSPHQSPKPLSFVATQPLLGFAHGTSGILWALQKYGQEFDFSQNWVSEALKYERQHYSHVAMNWPDYRVSMMGADQSPHYMSAWCHGAMGIGLARLDLEKAGIIDLAIRQEIRDALSTTEKHFGEALNLCHGDCGKLELFLKAYQHNYFSLEQLIHYIGITENYLTRTQAVSYENLAGVFIPGLMTGAAGVAYQFMRLASPERIPSILLLEPPAHEWH